MNMKRLMPPLPKKKPGACPAGHMMAHAYQTEGPYVEGIQHMQHGILCAAPDCGWRSGDFDSADEAVASWNARPSRRKGHPHKSLIAEERFFHIRDEGGYAGTVFWRKASNGEWIGVASVVHSKDQFCRRTGRETARRRWFKGTMAFAFPCTAQGDVNQPERPTYADSELVFNKAKSMRAVFGGWWRKNHDERHPVVDRTDAFGVGDPLVVDSLGR